MNAQDRFRKHFLMTQHQHTRLFTQVLAALQVIDPHVTLLPVDQAVTSQAINRVLWDALPGEHFAYHFDSPESLTSDGRWCLEQRTDQRIIFHLGWDVMAFSTTIEAAWETWPHFCRLRTDTYNVCTYPDSFAWYIIRAGNFLYPMHCVAHDTAQLMQKKPL